MPTYGVYTYPPSWYSPYLSPPPSTVTPPVETYPGRPIVGTLPSRGCGGGSVAVSVPGAAPVAPPSLSTSGVSGSGVKISTMTGDSNMFAGINWGRDWWKFLAGAVAYRLLSK